MDEADNAQIKIDIDSERAIIAARLHQPEAYFCGVCIECEEPVEYPKRWCSKSCCDVWSLRKNNRINQ